MASNNAESIAWCDKIFSARHVTQHGSVDVTSRNLQESALRVSASVENGSIYILYYM